MADFRTTFLPALDRFRNIPASPFGLRLHNVQVLTRTWSGARAGVGTKTDSASLSLRVDLGIGPVKVRNVTQRDIIASGGLYTDQDVIVGPITPPYTGSSSDNDAIAVFDPPVGSSPTEVFFRITGPGYTGSGDWFEKIQTRVDKPFRYELVLRKTGQLVIGAPIVSAIAPSGGSIAGGTPVTITGSGFIVGTTPTVTIAGTLCTSVVVLNATTITAITGAHAAGIGDVVVTNFDGQQGTLPQAYVYEVLFLGAKVTSFTASNYLSASPTSFPGFGPGKTLVYLFSWDAPAAEAGDFECLHIAGTAPGGNTALAGDKGYLLTYSTTAGEFLVFFLNGASTVSFPIPQQPVCGLNLLVLWNDGTNVKWTLTGVTNGLLAPGAVGSHASPTYVAPDSGSIQQIGTWGYPTGPNFYSGGVLAFAALSRVPTTNAEALGWAQSVAPLTSANRFTLPTALTGDPSCTVDWNAARDWNGSASTSTSLGSAPITWTINGSPTRAQLVEASVTALATSVADTGVAAQQGAFINADPLATLVFNTPTSQQQVGFAFVNNDPSVTTTNFTEMGAWVDGAFAAQVVAGPSVYNDGNPHLFWLPAGTAPTATQTAHAVKLYTGAQIEEPSGGTIVGGYLAGFQGAQGQTFTTTAPQKRLVLVGDSTAIGYYQTPPQNGLTALLRTDYPTTGGPGGIICYAAGGRRLYDRTAGGTSFGAEAAAIVARCQKVASGGTKTGYVLTGINDYFVPVANWTAAAFGTAYGALLDAINALDPTIALFAQSMIQAHYYAVQNSNGDKLSDFNTAIANACASRTFVTYVNATGWNDITFSDFIHPDIAGYAAWKAHVKTALAY